MIAGSVTMKADVADTPTVTTALPSTTPAGSTISHPTTSAIRGRIAPTQPTRKTAGGQLAAVLKKCKFVKT